MRRKTLICALSLAAAGLLLGPDVNAGPGPKDKGKGQETIKVQLKGLEEAPVVISGASGELTLIIDEADQVITYELTYQDLEGIVSQAHIHIGQKDVAGGIAMWLCQGSTVAPDSVKAITPTCPGPNSGTVSGTLTAANVIGPVGQAVPAGAFDDVLTTIRKGKAYGNVHSSSAPTGEIRGQLH